MESILNKQFDEVFQSSINHFNNYPELLPFIGKNWNKSKRILILGESHYLPYNEIKLHSTFDYFNNWYEGNSSGLTNYENRITTRNNIFRVEQNIYEKPLSMYFNLKKALLELPEFTKSPIIFDKFSYYNYFQKPALSSKEKNENRSINATVFDKKFAFETLLKVTEIIQPKTIIFASKKSYDAFMQAKTTHDLSTFKEIKVDFVPHAGRQWWNQKSRIYGNRTGREKFIDLIKECYL